MLGDFGAETKATCRDTKEKRKIKKTIKKNELQMHEMNVLIFRLIHTHTKCANCTNQHTC